LTPAPGNTISQYSVVPCALMEQVLLARCPRGFTGEIVP